MTSAERISLAVAAREVARAMACSVDQSVGAPSGLDFLGLYAAAKSIADALGSTFSPKELEIADAIAKELMREKLAAAGLSCEGPH